MIAQSLLKIEAATLTSAALHAVFNPQNPIPTASEQAEIAAHIVYPPDSALGHVGFPCHRLAKLHRKSPQAISEMLAQSIQDTVFQTEHQPLYAGLLCRVTATGGYLNFFCDLNKLFQLWKTGVAHQTLHQLPTDHRATEKIIVEFSQPNTHKALHIGHMRNMIYGDAVCNLLAYAGHDVIRATFPGDMGTHIAKALWNIHRQNAPLPTEHQATWLGHKYAEADQALKKVENTPTEALYKTEISQILQELEAQSGPFYKLYIETREWSLQEMKRTYGWLGIRFDAWFFESECDQSSRKLAQDLHQKGFFVDSQGAIGLDLNAYSLGFAVYLKSDGTGLYITKDLELVRRKFEDKSITKSIVVVDSRQKLHFQQLFKTAELLGWSQPGQSVHLAYESVVDETGRAFSSRDLNGTSLEELRGLICKQVTEDYLAKYKDLWPVEEITQTAHDITLGALKYGMLRYDSNRIVQFVLSEWIQLEGETGPYLQYTHARCMSVLGKVARGNPAEQPQKAELLEHASEQELMLFLERFHDVCMLAAKEFRPSVLTAYLFDLCRVFNRFYKECPIKNAKTEAQKEIRLSLVDATAYTLRRGLTLLGIPAPLRL